MTITSPEVQQFIRDHERDDERSLVLKHKEIFGLPSSAIAEQITGRRKAKEKLPSYYKANNIIYPPAINLEQSSSEQTANYKLEIITKESRSVNSIVDLTGGFGVDSFYFSRIFKQVHYVEPDGDLLKIAKHNHEQLGATNIVYHHTTAETFLSGWNDQIDCIYIDPSRRTKSNKKVFSLSDSEPDITKLQTEILRKTTLLLVKTSPLLDITLGIKELQHVKKVHVVAVNNECKEVLFQVQRDFIGEPLIEAVSIKEGQHPESFTFLYSDERSTTIEHGDPLKYLYEPNAALMKAGPFKSLANRYHVTKIHPSTHLYTSDVLVKDFPGRVFEIEACIKPEAKSVQSFFPEGKANVMTRNYPLSVDELKRKTKLTDGGEKYLIAFSGMKEKFVCVARRLKDSE